MVSAKRRTREEDFTIKQGGTERQGTEKKIGSCTSLKIKKEVAIGLVNVGFLLPVAAMGLISSSASPLFPLFLIQHVSQFH
jgi:hypothetical protein